MQVLKQENKFISPEPPRSIRFADDGPEPLSDFHQQGIACRVSQAVIDLLEPIKIQLHHRKRLLLTLGSSESVLETIPKEDSIDQTRQPIVGGLVGKRLLTPFDFLRHRVEQLGQPPKFVSPLHNDAMGQVARAEEPRCFPQTVQWPQDRSP